MTTTKIPARVLSTFRWAMDAARAHNRQRAEFVRVYGHGRGIDEFRASYLARTNRGPEGAATAREILALAAPKGITARELIAAATGR